MSIQERRKGAARPKAAARPKGKVAERHEANFRRVLLAVYMLSDEVGLEVLATNKWIANECGLSVEAVRRALAEMRRRGVIDTFDWRDGIAFRLHVLTDHPSALDRIEELSSYGRDRARRA